jgi:hypothetical protein
MADFVDSLARINAMADRMPGFVWRLIGDGTTGGVLELRPFPDPMMAVNMRVWKTVEDLERYVWQTVHKKFYNRKAEWFEKLSSHHFVMWFVAEGHIPTLVEASERLQYLEAHGNTNQAFTWSHLEHIKLWQSQKCG